MSMSMIHRMPETNRIVTIKISVEINLGGLQVPQENDLAAMAEIKAKEAVCLMLNNCGYIFHKQQTWDVNVSTEIEEDRT